MKAVLAVLLLAVFFSLPASADFEPDTDYMAIMIEAAVEGDMEKGLAAQQSRYEKIGSSGLELSHVNFYELFLLSKIIQAEAGSNWLDENWKMAVGEVVLNRVDSPEFPDSIEEVVYQPGQYYGRDSSFFNALTPSEESAKAAAKLLSGQRVLNEPSVVFQANFVLGSGVHLELEDSQLGSTYLCYSSHPELYVA